MLSGEASEIGWELAFLSANSSPSELDAVVSKIDTFLLGAEALVDRIEAREVDQSALAGVANVKHILLDFSAGEQARISAESSVLCKSIREGLSDLKSTAKCSFDEKTDSLQNDVGRLTDILFDLNV